MLEKIEQLAEIDLKFNQQGLMPAVVQDYKTKEVLMVAYLNEKSLKLSLEKEETVFFSRSRQEIWHKGAGSGNTQKIKEIYYDCDQDTILFLVDPAGPACHTGQKSCFYRQLAAEAGFKKQEPQSRVELETQFEAEKVVDLLYQLILSRKKKLPKDSYTTYLFSAGIDKILKKVGEEAAEVIIAAKNESEQEVIYESADLFYHLLVLWAELNIRPVQIKKELKKRQN